MNTNQAGENIGVCTGSPLPTAWTWGTQSNLIADFGLGNGPVAVMLTCPELGALPDMLSHAQAGDLMIVQTAAAAVPPPGSDPGSAVASVCYALSFSTVRHLIVCGHHDCQMLRTMNYPAYIKSPSPQRGTLTQAYIYSFILQQLQNLCDHLEGLQRKVDQQLEVHAWVFERTTGKVRSIVPCGAYTASTSGGGLFAAGGTFPIPRCGRNS
jgi:carbonic anhydrase